MDCIELFYNQNPYPQPVEKALIPAKNYLFDLAYKAGMPGLTEINMPFKIWAPGCGTLLPIYLLLEFPDAIIRASDISKSTIDYVIKALESYPDLQARMDIGVESIESSLYYQEFDYIVATGVLHHMNNPGQGLKILNQALKSEGILETMVYNKSHRQYYGELKKLLRLLMPQYPDCKRNELKQFFQTLLNAETKSPAVKYYVDEAISLLDHDFATFLDVYMNPREVSYDLQELFAFLESGGFEFLSWRNPESWNLETRINNSEILEQYKYLTPFEKYEIVCSLDYDFSPYFSLYASKTLDHSRIRQTDFEKIIENLAIKAPQKQYIVQFNEHTCEIKEIDFVVEVYDQEIQKAVKFVQNKGHISLKEALDDTKINWARLINLPKCPFEFYKI